MRLIEQIRDAGVVGAGGAGFPTDRKLNCKAEILIINGIECEPLLRTDRHVMEQYGDEIVRTVRSIRDALGASRAVIALKKHYEAAVSVLEKAVKGTKVELYLSESFYPAGDEQNLVFSVTGRTVPTGGIPLDVGCVVCNVSTVLNIARAVEGHPVTDKMVTVSGSVTAPVTVTCPVGTPLARLLAAAGGSVGDCVYIVGGPLMGKVTEDLKQPVTKTTGGLLAIPKDHMLLAKKKASSRDAMIARAVCSQCSLCTQMCPRNAMGLNVQPHRAMRAFASGSRELLGDVNGIFSCCDCGICTYFACSFGLKPSMAMQQMKNSLAAAGIKPVKEVKYPPDGGMANKRIPTERLLWRLDLKRFDREAPLGGYVDSDEVRIPLKMHIGAPDIPLVSPGDRVRREELIARPDGLGANIHASIDGTVTAVTEDYIEIRR